LLLALASGGAQGGAAGERLERGIAQVRSGALEAGLLTLDEVARGLRADPPSQARDKNLARAYLYRGVAYYLLGERGLARVGFVRAISMDRAVELAGGEWPRVLVAAVEAARAEVAEERALERSTRKKGHRTALILGGLGVVGGAVAALALGPVEHERVNQEPVSHILGWTPDEPPLAGMTRVTFRGSGSDPDGESVSLNWTFGCGAMNAVGPIVTVVFSAAGDCMVKLTAQDGLGAEGTSETTIHVNGLTGTWRVSPATHCSLAAVRFGSISPQERTVDTNCTPAAALKSTCDGLVANPRTVHVGHSLLNDQNWIYCEETLRLQVSPDAQVMTGTATCTYYSQSYYSPCPGPRAVTLRRQ
jgi:hypothetical protein